MYFKKECGLESEGKLNCGSNSLGDHSKVTSPLRLQSHYQHKGSFQNSCSLGPFLDLVFSDLKKYITHTSLGHFKRESNEIFVFRGVMGVFRTSWL